MVESSHSGRKTEMVKSDSGMLSGIMSLSHWTSISILSSKRLSRIAKSSSFVFERSRVAASPSLFDNRFSIIPANLTCEGGVVPFDISEIHKYPKKVDGWDIIKDEKSIYFLEKKFNFKNFLESQKFVNEVGKISEEEGHHPEILFGWGYAKINITTHAIEGLSENDFILAAKIDKI